MKRIPVVRVTVAASVAVGLVSTAAVVTQAVALGSLLAGVMPGGRPADRRLELLGFAVAVLVRGAAAFAGEILARVGASRTKADLRSRLVPAALEGQSGAKGAGIGGVATVAGRGLDALDVYVGRCLPDFVLAAAAPVALVAAVGLLDWVSCIIIVAALVLFPVFGALVGKASGALAASRWTQVEALGRQVVDVFEGLPVLKAFARTAHQRDRIEQTNEALRRASLGTLKVAFVSALVLDELASISVAMVAVPLGLRLLHGSIHLSAALAVLIVAPEVFVPLRRASAEFHQSTEGLAAVASAMDMISSRPAGTAAGRGSLLAPPDASRVPIVFRDVVLAVPGRPQPILAGASLRIEAGETVCVVGPNGAGKSTLLSLLLGFGSPTSGLITVGDHDLTGIDPRAWREQIAYLPDHPTLLAGSLADNLRLAYPEATDDELSAALTLAGANDLVEDLALGLDTRMGEGGRQTSAGQRQRIALARVFLRPAHLYLLDEPTVHLDDRSENSVVTQLGRLLEDRSALIVTHRPAVLRIADRVVELDEGRLSHAVATPRQEVTA